MSPKRTSRPSRINEGIPISVAATSPLTMVVFDDADRLSPTLEEINHNTYDHLKLCRTTTAVDSEIPAMSGMGIIVSYSGAFLFPRVRSLEKANIIAAVNRLLLKLMFGGISFDAVAPNDVGNGTIYKTGYFLAGNGADGPNFSLLLALQHRAASNFDTIRLMNPRTITSTEFHAAIRRGTPLVEKLPEINASLFLNGLTHFRQYQLPSALVFLWSTAESMLGRLWKDRVIPNGVGISGRKAFVESNSWQAAHKAEVLFQIGALSERLYANLNVARAARNALAHRGVTPNLKACELALDTAFRLVSLVVTDGSQENEFDNLADHLKTVHQPFTGPLKPEYWRDIPAVPGDGKWGDQPYPRHPEIELQHVRIKGVKSKGSDSID